MLVIDLAAHWTDPDSPIGSDLDVVVAANARLLAAARRQNIPIFFTTFAYDPDDGQAPHDRKLVSSPYNPAALEVDARLGRRPGEKLIRKPYASAFKGTHLHELLTARGIDTLIVAGVSTGHCVYATCRDATDSFRVVVPREAVGDRCELLHEVNLFDIDVDLGDVMPLDEVIEHLRALPAEPVNDRRA